MNQDTPRATVRTVDGQLVLDDPDAVAVIRAVEKHNCRLTFEGQVDRVKHFVQRMKERGVSAADVVIVLINVDAPFGGTLAELLMPGFDWQAVRDQGQVPFARGLAGREGIEEALAVFDKDAAEKLKTMTTTAVVVVDHGVAEVFEA